MTRKEAEDLLKGIKVKDVNFNDYVTKCLKENGIVMTARKEESTQKVFNALFSLLCDMHLIEIDSKDVKNKKDYMIKINEVD